MGAYAEAVLVSIIPIPTYLYMYVEVHTHVEAVLVSCTARRTSLAVFEGALQTSSGM